MLFYIATRPQTVVSLINVGRFPDQLPDWVEPKTIYLFSTPQEAISSIQVPDANQLFLVEIDLPDSQRSRIIESHSSGTLIIQIPEIHTDWIKRMIVRSKTSEKLLRKFLNNEIRVPIELKPDLFSGQILKASAQQPLPPIGFSRSFASLAPLQSQMDEKVKFVRQGDILGSRMQTLINTINCVGIMGKGLAFSFKEAYPTMFQDYHRRCLAKEVQIGKPYLFKISDTRWILNFPTKDHWRQDSKVTYVEEGLKYLAAHYNAWGISSLAIPPLGCGNGRLSWEKDVYPLIEKHLFHLNIPIEIYAPFEKPSGSQKMKWKSIAKVSSSADNLPRKDKRAVKRKQAHI